MSRMPHTDKNFGVTSIMRNSAKGDLAGIRRELSKGATPNDTDENKQSPLTYAANAGMLLAVQLLLDSGAKIDHQNRHGYTALMYAASAGHNEIVKELLRRGAVVDLENNNGFTALMRAVIERLFPSILCGQTIFGNNLILNGNAEMGGTSGDQVVPIPGWTGSGAFTVQQYGGNGMHAVAVDAPNSSAHGSNYFTGGVTSDSSSAIQDVDVSAGAVEIDSSTVRFALAGYFGGTLNQNDDTLLTVIFFNEIGTRLGSNSVGGVLAADRPLTRRNTCRRWFSADWRGVAARNEARSFCAAYGPPKRII